MHIEIYIERYIPPQESTKHHLTLSQITIYSVPFDLHEAQEVAINWKPSFGSQISPWEFTHTEYHKSFLSHLGYYSIQHDSRPDVAVKRVVRHVHCCEAYSKLHHREAHRELHCFEAHRELHCFEAHRELLTSVNTRL